MALVKCIECGKLVSKNAKECPHCGTNKPVKIKFNLKSKFLGRVWMFFMFGVYPLILFLAKDTPDIFTIFGLFLFFGLIIMVILLVIESVAELAYYAVKGKELYPDEKEEH